MNQKVNYCPRCGGQINDGDRYCQKCGLQISQYQSNQPNVPPKIAQSVPKISNKKLVTVLIIGISFVFITIVIISVNKFIENRKIAENRAASLNVLLKKSPKELSPTENLEKAKSIIKDKPSTGQINEAIKHLEAIPGGAPEYKEAQSLIETAKGLMPK